MAEPTFHRLPLTGLPPPFGAATRLRDLRATELRDLLRAGPVRFLVADIATGLRSIPQTQCFTFWKSEVRPHFVADPDGRAYLDDFPGSYCYFASEWTDGGPPIVLLSVYH
jgi:hypothetical protein